MPISQLGTIGGDTSPWVPLIKRASALKRDGLNSYLVGTYTGNPQVLAESDWVYLQFVLYAEQIHPWTVDQVSALGGIEDRNAARWSMEGPTLIMPGEPQNCTAIVEVTHSLTSSPGSDWREWSPEKYKLRSYKMRLTITRPSLDFDFRVYRFASRATRTAPVQRDAVSMRFFHNG